MFGVGNVVAAASFIPIGLAADRFGRRPLLIGVWLTSTVGAAAFIPLTEWHGAFVGSTLYWVGSAALPLMSAHLAALTPRARLSGELGMVYGAFFFGTILASPFAGAIGAAVGLRGGIAIATIAFAVSSALTFRLSPTPPIAHVPGPPLPRSFWTLLAITPLAAVITTAQVLRPSQSTSGPTEADGRAARPIGTHTPGRTRHRRPACPCRLLRVVDLVERRLQSLGELDGVVGGPEMHVEEPRHIRKSVVMERGHVDPVPP